MFKVATWNVNSIRVRLLQVLDWLHVVKPDLLALQEIKADDENFPVAEFRDRGYQVLCNGQKTYNGVAIICSYTPKNIITDFPEYEDPQRRLLYASFDNFSVINIYVPNGSETGSDKFKYKLEWLSRLQLFVNNKLKTDSNLLVMGDFNIAPADEDVHDPDEWRGKVLVSGPERKHFSQLIDKGLVDCFRLLNQGNDKYSWWDYRGSGFARNRGLRIDHILASETLSKSCKSSYIDTSPRGLERPSDHAPVVAEFNL